jgi:hypothetical protein
MTTTNERIKYVKQLVHSGFKFEEADQQKVIFELFNTCFQVIDNLETKLAEKNALLNLLKTASQIIESADEKINTT